jgi:myo-inositol-1(or 4)-monophosphatase
MDAEEAVLERAPAALAEAARLAMGIMRRGARGTRWKGDQAGNWVSDADLTVEQAVRARLSAMFPDHDLAGEETGVQSAGGRWLWSIDPIDGTANFVHGLPWAAFSLGLLRQGEPVAGVVADPFRDEVWVGVVGRGVTLNGRLLPVPPARRLAGSLVLTELKDTRPWPGMTAWLERIAGNSGVVRVMGSTALALVACAVGRAAACVLHSPNLWDAAGGLALCRAAGVAVTDWRGRPQAVPEYGMVASALEQGAHQMLLDSLPAWRAAG